MPVENTRGGKPLRLAVADLFAGAGGISEGFRSAGFEVVAGSDLDPDAAATFKLNFPDADSVVGDIRKPAVREAIADAARTAHVVVGGPPCQAWSQVRNHTRLIDDPRNALYRQFVSIVAETTPWCFVMENVTGIDQMGAREQMLADLRLEGEYIVEPQVLDAADFGVPQTRKRLLFVGMHRTLEEAPPKVRGSGVIDAIALLRSTGAEPRYTVTVQNELFSQSLADLLADPDDLTAVTAEQAIGDLVLLPPGHRSDEIGYDQLALPSSAYQRLMRSGNAARLSNVQVPRLNADTRLRLQRIPAGGNYRDLPQDLKERYLTGQRWGQDNGSGKLSRRHFYAYRRLHPAIWAWTLNTKADAVYHYSVARGLSVREFARLQSFPDSFVFTTDPRPGRIAGRLDGGPAHSRYRQVGNAVPPLLARAVASAVEPLLMRKLADERKTA
jgi:DNA (cytosine-5)-methyltransferase 1